MIRYLDTERTIRQFIDDDKEFLDWIRANAACGYILSFQRCKGPDADAGFIAPGSYIKFHRASCWRSRQINRLGHERSWREFASMRALQSPVDPTFT